MSVKFYEGLEEKDEKSYHQTDTQIHTKAHTHTHRSWQSMKVSIPNFLFSLFFFHFFSPSQSFRSSRLGPTSVLSFLFFFPPASYPSFSSFTLLISPLFPSLILFLSVLTLIWSFYSQCPSIFSFVLPFTFPSFRSIHLFRTFPSISILSSQYFFLSQTEESVNTLPPSSFIFFSRSILVKTRHEKRNLTPDSLHSSNCVSILCSLIHSFLPLI